MGVVLEGDEDVAVAALHAAHVPSLAVAVACLTGDLSLLRGLSRPRYLEIADFQGRLDEAEQARVRDAALAALRAYRQAPGGIPELDRDVLGEMMEFVAGTDMPSEYGPFMFDMLGIGQPRAPVTPIGLEGWLDGRGADVPVLIIGAGMSGIHAAMELQAAGVDFVIVESHHEVGGTWAHNRYPGCRVDTANHLYCYTSERIDEWPHKYSTQPTLLKYFKSIVAKYDLEKHIRFHRTVDEMIYDESQAVWQVRLRRPDGGTETVRAATVVGAVGQLNLPRYPDIPGMDLFQGLAFHSARWPEGVDLTGKRVAVIGTGASAFQFVPAIADQVGEMTIFQRSAPWMSHTPDYHDKVPDGTKWLLRNFPYYAAWYRFWLFYMATDGFLPSVMRAEDWDDSSGTISAANAELRETLLRYMEGEAGGDAALFAKMKPNYVAGSKRLLRDNGAWGRALRQPNVDVVTEAIARIDERGIVTADGAHHAFDIIVYGTGFRASEFLLPIPITGRGGLTLQDFWQGDARAYLGMTIPGFPNLFCIYGPNTNIVANGSIVFFSECAVHYIVESLRLMAETGCDAMEVREPVFDGFNRMIDARNAQTAWGTDDVTSWYKNANGRVSQNWPLRLVDYWTATRAPNAAEYILHGCQASA